ncbi:MAG: preprotein translocase subunit YajC [Bdellovibrionales bacterium]
MFDFVSLFVSPAMAQDVLPVGTEEATQSAMMNYLPFILIFAVFYFLVIRPQQKKLVEQDKMIKALQRGDRVVTSGGIHGKIAKIADEGHLLLEIAEGVQIKINRDNIMAVENVSQTAAVPSGEDGK